MLKKYRSKIISVLITLVMLVSLLQGMTMTAYAAVNQTLSGAQAGIKFPFKAENIFGADANSAYVYFGKSSDGSSDGVQLFVGDESTLYSWGEGYDGTEQFYFYAPTPGTYTFIAGTEGLPFPSVDTEYTITVNVTSLNTAPTFTGGANTGLTVNEDAGVITITSSKLEVKDTQQSAESLKYTVVAAPSKGQLKKNGENVNSGGTFTQSDIDNNLITFTPSANQYGASNFTFSVSDGQGGTLSGQTFTITISGINDSPTGLPTINGTGTENQLLTASVAGIADIDGLGAYSYQWQVSADGSSGWSNIIGATTSTYTLTSGEAGKYVRVRVSYTDGGGTSEVLYSSATTKIVSLGKTLTADTTNNDVDHDIVVTFGADAAFEGAITGVSFNGTALTATTDYVVSSGKVTLKPSGGNAALQTPATANVVITATGYNNSTISQTIKHGATAVISTTQNISAPTSNGGNFALQPIITLKDMYGNTCTSDNTTIITAAKEDAGTWTLTGTTTVMVSSGVATFTNLGATNTALVNNVQLCFTSGVMTKVTSSIITLPAPASGGSSTGSPSSTTETIKVDVKNGDTDNTVTQITIERTTNSTGQKTDNITYDTTKAKESVQELQKNGADTARIYITDNTDKVEETKVNIPVTSIGTLADGAINLQIDTEVAKIDLTKNTLTKIEQGSDDDLYFRLVPVKDKTQKETAFNNALIQAVKVTGNSDSTATIIGNPIMIETNMSSMEADISLPLTGLTIPTDPAERAAFLQQLAVYIEHSDGSKEFVQGELVAYRDGTYGIKFHITKFSTFTVVKTNAFQKSTTVTKVENGFAPLRLKAEGQKTSQKLTFTKVSGADGYIIYGSLCGIDNHLIKLVDLTSNSTSYKVTGLKEDSYYKYQVKAYRLIDGKKVVIATSLVIHTTTMSSKYDNPSKVKSNVSSLSLKLGMSKQLKCSLVLAKDKKMEKHIALISYESTNTNIATVNNKGKIVAVGKGTCYVYAYAQNGVYIKIKITVK